MDIFRLSRHRSTQSGLPNLLSKEAYSRLRYGMYRNSVWDPAKEEQIQQLIQTTGVDPTEVHKAAEQMWSEGHPDDAIQDAIIAELSSLAQRHTAELETEVDGLIRIASLREIPADFRSVGGGFYRSGHTIWELRAAEDEEGGYLLARKHEERAVDLRGRDVQAEIASTPPVQYGVCRSCLKPGTRVAFINQGQVMPVIVIKVEDDSAEVEDDAGTRMPAPLDMIVTDMTVQMPGAASAAPAAQPLKVEMVQPQQSAPQMQGPAQALEQVLQQAPEMIGEGEAMSEAMMFGGGEGAPMQPMADAPHGCDCQTGCPCPCHNGKSVKKGPQQGMEPKVEPSSKDPDAQGEEHDGSEKRTEPAANFEPERESEHERQAQRGKPFRSGQRDRQFTLRSPIKQRGVQFQPGTKFQISRRLEKSPRFPSGGLELKSVDRGQTLLMGRDQMEKAFAPVESTGERSLDQEREQALAEEARNRQYLIEEPELPQAVRNRSDRTTSPGRGRPGPQHETAVDPTYLSHYRPAPSMPPAEMARGLMGPAGLQQGVPSWREEQTNVKPVTRINEVPAPANENTRRDRGPTRPVRDEPTNVRRGPVTRINEIPARQRGR